MKKFLDLIVNERFITTVVVLNAVVIFLQESGLNGRAMVILDTLCTAVFVAEMVVKQCRQGVRGYWREGWNAFDGVVTLVSLPSVVFYFVPLPFLNTGFVQVLRVLRIFKLLRTGRVFPNLRGIVRAFRMALKESAAVLLGFLLMVFTLALVNCVLFRAQSPEYFGTPLDAAYSIFRLFTVEGWYEIPDAIAGHLAPVWSHLVRAYFCLLLIGGGIVGMSLINSIFVDAMVADNNDDVKEQLRRIEEKLDGLQKSEKEPEDK